MYVHQIFDNYASYTGLPVVVGMLLYTLQLYSEFSGCMDIVRGSAQMFGIGLSENFNQPFMSKTVSELDVYKRQLLLHCGHGDQTRNRWKCRTGYIQMCRIEFQDIVTDWKLSC